MLGENQSESVICEPCRLWTSLHGSRVEPDYEKMGRQGRRSFSLSLSVDRVPVGDFLVRSRPDATSGTRELLRVPARPVVADPPVISEGAFDVSMRHDRTSAGREEPNLSALISPERDV